MPEQVVVLGAGYAGAGAIMRLQDDLDESADLVWISDRDYHLVLHESHRIIRDPSIGTKITIPIAEIAAPSTTFRQGTVVGVDVDAREIELDDGEIVPYDYLLIAIGSQTPYYGIPGLAEHSHTLKSLDDALEIHERVAEAAREASASDPARVIVGGAGLSGVQTAGEVAEYRDRHDAPIEIVLAEALDEIMPGSDAELQKAIRRRLEDRDVRILTGNPIVEAEPEVIHFDEGEPLPYDVLVWTGGITGRDALETADVEKEHNRVNADSTFQTSDERVFAIGDTAIVEQGGTDVAPPTAQAAWQAADVAAENIVRTLTGRPLRTWTFEDKGTLISVGEDAVAHDVQYFPLSTFGSVPAKTLKKFVAARWIAGLTSWNRAMRAWNDL